MQRREFIKLLSGCGYVAARGASAATGDAFTSRWLMGGDDEH